MLTSLILTLQAPAEMRLPATLGRAAQALLLRLIGEKDGALAAALHEGEGPRPYTVSNLVMGRREQGALEVQAGQTGWLRFTGLTGEVSGHLLGLAVEPPETVELDGRSFTVTGATVDPAAHSWAGEISYQDLAAPFLLGSQRRITPSIAMEFVSPTTFRSQGRYVPLPLPELVFGSLLDRWQRFAPIALSPEVRRFAAEAVALSRYQLRTRGLPYKQGIKLGEGQKTRGTIQIGFTGHVVFVALNRDRYWLNVLHLLAAFAFYSGVGYQTGTGLGQVRAGQEQERASS